MGTTTSSPEPAPLYIVGLGLPSAAEQDPAAIIWPAPPRPLLDLADVLIGGRAQLASVGEHPAERLVVGADIPGLLRRVEANRHAGKRQVALCSGDPLFFGLGARFREYFGPEGLYILPAVSSLQGAAALIGLPWERIRCVSLHGRSSCAPLAQALLTGEPVCILTNHPLADLARFLTERGCTAYRLHALNNLRTAPSGIRAEDMLSCSLKEALNRHHMTTPDTAGVVILEPLDNAAHTAPTIALREAKVREGSEGCSAITSGGFGIPDTLLAREDNLFTKWPVRAAGLAALRIAPRHIVWDLGSGSGSVALEAAFLAYQGQVIAVEKNLRRVEDIVKNRRQFGAATLEIVHGCMPECLVTSVGTGYASSIPDAALPAAPYYSGTVTLPRPHRVFLGGGLGGTAGEAAAMLSRVWDALLPGGRLVLHCILLESLERARVFLRGVNAEVEILSMQTSHARPLGGDMYFEGANPIFLVIAQKPDSTAGACPQ